MINRPKTKHSRREVQRRFPPGSLVVSQGGKLLSFIVGWAPTPGKRGRFIYGEVHPDVIVVPSSWEAWMIDPDARVRFMNWETLRKCMTIDEWGEWYTCPG